MAAVAHRLQDTYEYVVHYERQRSAEINPEICDGIRQYGRRRTHPYQDLGSGKDAYKGEDTPADQPESDGGMDGPLEVLKVPRSEIPGNYDARSDGNSVEEPDHQKDKAAGGADGGKRRVAKEVTDD